MHLFLAQRRHSDSGGEYFYCLPWEAHIAAILSNSLIRPRHFTWKAFLIQDH